MSLSDIHQCTYEQVLAWFDAWIRHKRFEAMIAAPAPAAPAFDAAPARAAPVVCTSILDQPPGGFMTVSLKGFDNGG